MIHRPVLLKEVLEIFDPRLGETYIDATVDGGGHTRGILEKIGPAGRVLGIDRDCELLKKVQREFQKEKVANITFICDSYVNIRSIARAHGVNKAHGILFDLGLSRYHLEEARRGFSFLKDEPLDMRFDPTTNELTASQIVNTWPPEAIETALRAYGEERFARSIARGIVRARRRKPIASTGELTEIIRRSVPRWYRSGRRHPATRTFQALRIAVNSELDELMKALPESISLLAPNGKIVVISYHSLEDRIVKQCFKEKEKEGALSIISAKPVRPSREEVRVNPSARSGRLRAAMRPL